MIVLITARKGRKQQSLRLHKPICITIFVMYTFNNVGFFPGTNWADLQIMCTPPQIHLKALNPFPM